MQINNLVKLGLAGLFSLILSACSGSGDGNPDVKLLVATPDVATDVNGATGATSVVNVLTNDFVQGSQATTSSVVLTETSPDASGVLTLNSDGSVDVAAGSAAGIYTRYAWHQILVNVTVLW